MLTAARIKAKAGELGFDLCGIAPADNFPELAYLEEWLAHGYAGDMAYMARSAERRADVRNVVAGARSVIVTGTIYNTLPPTESESGDDSTHNETPRRESSHHLTPTRANIARYALGDDYHDVLKRRLDALLAWMRASSPVILWNSARSASRLTSSGVAASKPTARLSAPGTRVAVSSGAPRRASASSARAGIRGLRIAIPPKRGSVSALSSKIAKA